MFRPPPARSRRDSSRPGDRTWASGHWQWWPPQRQSGDFTDKRSPEGGSWRAVDFGLWLFVATTWS